MKKIIPHIASAIVIGSMLMPFLLVGAQAENPPAPPTWGQAVSIETVLGLIFNFIFIAFVIVAAIGLVIAGFLFISAAGDPDKLSKARNFVLYTLIAVVIAAASKLLVWAMYNIAAKGQNLAG